MQQTSDVRGDIQGLDTVIKASYLKLRILQRRTGTATCEHGIGKCVMESMRIDKRCHTDMPFLVPLALRSCDLCFQMAKMMPVNQVEQV